MMFGKNIINKNIRYIPLIIILIFFDQFSKYFIENNFSLYNSLYITNFLNITFVINYGFAFGFLNNPNYNQFIIIILIGLIVIYLLFIFYNNKEKYSNIGLVLILSGAFGNFIDRIIRGYIVDFLDFNISKFHWPAFNFADSYITIGFIFMLYSLNKNKKK